MHSTKVVMVYQYFNQQSYMPPLWMTAKIREWICKTIIVNIVPHRTSYHMITHGTFSSFIVAVVIKCNPNGPYPQ